MAGGRRAWLLPVAILWMTTLMLVPESREPVRAAADPHAPSLFATSHDCIACHNSLVSSSGEDVSIGVAWRASMMANSSRDPYWQGSVRRETLDHPSRKAEIEDECSVCHMPMARAQAQISGQRGAVFAHLPVRASEDESDRLAADGVSCALCHQITSDRLGTAQSFVGRFVLSPGQPGVPRPIFGPVTVDAGRSAVMRSVTGMKPDESKHVQQSELCATCHTLITEALGEAGEVIGSIPEQVPYQEWRHSAYRDERSCQSCHMPELKEPTRIASVLGEIRDRIARHTFLGGNFFMLRMLNRYRTELGVEAPAQELDASARATLRQLQADTAALSVGEASVAGSTLDFTVDVRNSTGHKFPTGYPARRAWLHVTVRGAGGRVVFESGAVTPQGSIVGNDGDADAGRFERHHDRITSADDVQIYESVMADRQGRPTTGLLQATAFVKDNRLLPRGFDKRTAESDIAVRGDALEDGDFGAGGDRVRYAVALAGATGPFEIAVELRYQPIAFRWADNLRAYDAPEPRRFVSYYQSMAEGSSTVVARAAARVP